MNIFFFFFCFCFCFENQFLKMDNGLKAIIDLGKELGYEGNELRDFVKEQQVAEREERAAEREERSAKRVAEEEEKRRQFELEKLRLQSTGVKLESENEEKTNWLSLAKLLPKFNESNVTKYFASFEKLMKLADCPEEYWCLLLQSVLVGKALETYSCLADEQSSQYAVVKEAILNAYKLVPEAYRLRFRDAKKTDDQTYLEFARVKEQYFTDWCNSVVVKSQEDLKEIILLEDFKNNMPPAIKLYIEESQVSKLTRAAELADEFALTHYLHGKSQDRDKREQRQGKFHKQGNKEYNKSSSQKSVHNAKDLTCFYCKRKGHIIKDCFKYKASKGDGQVVNYISRVPDFDREFETREWRKTVECFGDHLLLGTLSVEEKTTGNPIQILRDTGAAVSLVCRSKLPKDLVWSDQEYVLVGGFPNSCVSCPVQKVFLDTSLVKGYVKLAVVDTLPVRGVDLLLGNDLVKGESFDNPIITKDPVTDGGVQVVTRSGVFTTNDDLDLDFEIIQEPDLSEHKKDEFHSQALEREDLIKAQQIDEGLKDFFEKSISVSDITDLTNEEFVVKEEVLYRYHRPLTALNSDIVEQIVVPCKLREKVLSLGHDDIFAGHLGVNKTLQKIKKSFFWPFMKRDVKRYVNSCHECQIAGKPNKPVPKAPLINIPSVGKPFEEVVIDMVGPLPKSKRGNEYILTMIDRMSRYPEAIPVRNMKAKTVVDHLIQYFSRFGLPKKVKSDNGSNFTSKYFKACTFQRLMNHIISGIEGCIVYLDDLVIFTDSWGELLQISRKVLDAISRANLMINLRKCEFGKGNITYLGHQIGGGKVYPKEGNVKAILEFPVPENKRQAMRFIGMVGYFRRFVPNFSDIAAPITSLFEKGRSFKFDEKCMSAFAKLKSVMISRPVLETPDFREPFKIAVDASDIGVGAVLIQDINGREHPISYFSKKLDKSQLNYSTIEKDLLALVLALKHFEVYVSGLHPVTILTDHNPLLFLNKFRNKNRRLTRWSLELQDLNIVIKYKKGTDNKVADALSRVMVD